MTAASPGSRAGAIVGATEVATHGPQHSVPRLFLAWQPDDAARAALAALRDTLAAQRPDPQLQDGTYRWTPTANLHLTLRFLGDTPREREIDLRERVAALAATTRAMSARAAGWQYWPSRGNALPSGSRAGCAPTPDRRAPRVLVLRLESEGTLERLGGALETLARDCGFAPERKPFRAHLTLARIGRLRAPVEPLLAPPPPLAIAIDHVALIQSTLTPEGAVYAERARWRLV